MEIDKKEKQENTSCGRSNSRETVTTFISQIRLKGLRLLLRKTVEHLIRNTTEGAVSWKGQKIQLLQYNWFCAVQVCSLNCRVLPASPYSSWVIDTLCIQWMWTEAKNKHRFWDARTALTKLKVGNQFCSQPLHQHSFQLREFKTLWVCNIPKFISKIAVVLNES